MRFLALLVIVAAVSVIAPCARAERYLLRFDGSAYGIVPLGDATIDLGMSADGYVSAATVRSGGLAVLFDRTEIRAQSEGAADGAALTFRRYQLDHSYARKRRLIDMSPTPDGIEAAITPPLGDPMEIRPTDAQKLGARDPLSSLTAMAAQVAATGSCAGVFPTFDGRFRYDLIVRIEGRDQHVGGGYDGPVQKCKVRFKPIAGYRTAREMERRIPEGEIWFAMIPGARLAPPVRVSAPLPLGHAGIRLRSFKRAAVDIGEQAAD